MLLPYPSWHPDYGCGDGIEAVVAKVDSDYNGYLRPILGIVKRAVPVVINGLTKPASAPTPVNTKAKRLVKVKEIEQLVREASTLTIDGRKFQYGFSETGTAWREV